MLAEYHGILGTILGLDNQANCQKIRGRYPSMIDGVYHRGQRLSISSFKGKRIDCLGSVKSQTAKSVERLRVR